MQEDLVWNASYSDFVLNGFSELGEWRPFLFTPFLLMFLLSLSANSFLLFIIISQNTLHTPMCILIAGMAVVDLILPVFFVPNMLFSFLLDWRGISLAGCLMQMFCIHFIGAFQSTFLIWMALDRYFAICTPLYYHNCMTINNVMKYVIPPLIRNALLIIQIVILAGRLSFCHTNVIDHCFCEHMALVRLACGSIHINNLTGLLAVFLIPTADFIFITISYVIIFVSVFRSGKSQVKAINTCLTHIIVMTLSLIIGLLAFMSYRIKNNISQSSRVFISTMYLFFPSCLNPIIYGIRTKEIRERALSWLHLSKGVSCP
ncbi:olfactory receptor 52E8-like [Osmerus mordax]|uniref:olfactory receptor 52E8-like n=1 Tax=Osmerus mordax TaxID=8014 RepID=UPI00350ECBF7